MKLMFTKVRDMSQYSETKQSRKCEGDLTSINPYSVFIRSAIEELKIHGNAYAFTKEQVEDIQLEWGKRTTKQYSPYRLEASDRDADGCYFITKKLK